MPHPGRKIILAFIGFIIALGALAGGIILVTGVLVTRGRPLGAIVVGVPYQLQTLDPLAQPLDPNEPEAISPFRLVYDTLVISGPDGRIHPHLATSWEIGAGGREITFRLRPAVFHDGRPVDAGAVKYTLDRILTDPRGKALAATLGPLEKVEILAQDRVRLVFERPFPPIFSALSWSALGIVAPPSGSPAAGRERLGPVGSGPFRPESWTEAGLTLVRDDARRWASTLPWAGGVSRLERVTFRFLPEPGSRLLAFRRGQLDLAELDPGNYPEALGLPGARILLVPRPSLTYLGFSVSGENQVGTALREAATLAINREALLRASGWPAQPETTFLPRGMWAIQLPRRARADPGDPGRAREVLEAAGWRDLDGDGLVETPDPEGGRPTHLSLEILTYNYDWERRLTAEVVAQLREVGIDAVGEPLEPREVLGRTRDGRAQAFVLTYNWYDPDIAFYLFHSTRVGLTNRSGLSDPVVDRAIESALLAVDPAARSTAYGALAEILKARLVWVPLASQATPVAVRGTVTGLIIGGADEILLSGTEFRPER